ncbi:PAS domain-containing protein [Daejeonella oryzae]|uniref:PAS domain-containing protein n=1 Tax=Daejeonella oryzae TaxID=1122943 RepID=UPI00047BA4B6|nr:PAS domain-containing protein [Daejeonella oryzae]
MNHLTETRQLLENSTLYYIICSNMEGKYSYINNKYKRAFGNIHGEIIGQPYYTTIHPDDTEICHRVSAQCFEFPEKVFPATIRKHDGKGGFVFTQWEYKAMINEQGEPEGIFCLGYDITEFRNNSMVLSESLKTLDEKEVILRDIAFNQSHIIRKPVANILGLGLILQHMEMDPNLRNVISLMLQSAEELDVAIKTIVDKANA